MPVSSPAWRASARRRAVRCRRPVRSAPGQVPAQPAARLGPVDRLVDRLVDQVPAGLAGELAAQRLTDLLRASRLRGSSRLTVDGLRPSCAAAARTPSPAARRSAMLTLSSSGQWNSKKASGRVYCTRTGRRTSAGRL
jgi:hypothetical protein